MCTAITYQTKDFYFGRTLDYEQTYGEQVTFMPRKFPLKLRHLGVSEDHYAMIGMAHVAQGYPLYYDAVNEKGLGMAGLNFVGNAVFNKPVLNKANVASFELIPWILSCCATVKEAIALMENMNLTDEAFSREYPPAELHWLLADRKEAMTVESTREGLKILTNPVGVLTNNPPFDKQFYRLHDFMSLSSRQPRNHFSEGLSLQHYSRGMGALGLPGDLTSQSRFVRASFVKMNSSSGSTEEESVNQFFHILGTVEQVRGCCEVRDGEYEITQYTSCCNASKGIYYYTTYDNHQITGVDMHRENMNGNQLVCYPLSPGEKVRMEN